MLKKLVFCWILKVNDENSRIRIQHPDPDPDPFVRGIDPRIRIHPKMSWIHSTDVCYPYIFRNRFRFMTLKTPNFQIPRRLLCSDGATDLLRAKISHNKLGFL